MQGVLERSELFSARGFAASRQLVRTPIYGAEHDTKPLPADMIRSDGTLDLYADVGKLFQPVFDGGVPSIRCGGWIGYIPLNDRYALEVSPRVPIGNLERLFGMAAGYSPRILENYTRHFSHSDELPASLLDVLADQLLGAFDRVWENGLLKSYERKQRIGSSPFGRIEPFQTAWRSAKAGLPTAVSSAFHRTTDFAPNRILRFAFEKLLARYHGNKNQSQRRRILRIRQAAARLEDLDKPSRFDMAPEAVARTIRHLPIQHEGYADALMLAQLIISDAGFSIRGNDGMAILPSIIIDMTKVFESYVRRVLADHFKEDADIAVWDGNTAAPAGAKKKLFDPIETGVQNVPVKPDIVIEVKGDVRLVIDTKYKPAPKQPERDDVNQAVMYGARYGAKRVMLLYAGRAEDESSVSLLGKVGPHQVYNGRANLNAGNIENEEKQLAAAIAALL
jgi:5-methylcytosine-specific restriction enzyme subunit McrC